MTSFRLEATRPLSDFARTRRPIRFVRLFAISGVAALALTGCTGGHKKATALSSVSAVASGSAPVAISSAAVSSASAPASSAAATAASSAPPPVSSLPPGIITAEIEAPATKAGFQIRLHRGSTIKVDAQQAPAGATLTFTVSPATAKTLTPIADHPGYYKGTTDGLATVSVSAGSTALGTIAITVWG
jgi:hypothetical protein